MFLYTPEAAAIREARLANLVDRVLHRLADSAQKIWTYAEIESYLQRGALELAADVPVVWDQLYLEDPVVPSPTPGLYLLPPELVAIDRVTWDHRSIDATSPARLRQMDDQYEITEGEVYAYSWRNEGPRTFRKIRVPNVVSDSYVVDGSWGILRDMTDIGDPDIEGSWGIPRRVPMHFPMGDTVGWGTPRRVYKDGRNVRVEHWRQFRTTALDSELPHRYFLYLLHYCQWRALIRNGPGQDYKLGQAYKTLWDRGLKRIRSRGDKTNRERVSRMGGTTGVPGSSGRPPRPKLPWQYGDTVR